MKIRSLIKKRFQENSFKIHSKEGNLISSNIVSSEYQKIKNYLLENLINEKAIPIMMDKDYHYFLVILASMEIGIPYIPLKSDYPENRISQIKEDIYFSQIITDDLVQNILKAPLINTDNIEKEITSTSPLYIIFTSGSTGKPKGVEINRMACENYFSWIDAFYSQVTSSDRFLQITEFTFDISLIDIGFFLTKNVSLYFSTFERDIFKLAYELEINEISIISTVPNNLNMLLDNFIVERANFNPLKEILIGGARFSTGLHQRCKKHFNNKNIYNLYGPTECTIYTHVKKLSLNDSDFSEDTVSIGKPIQNVDSIIYEKELLLGGVQLMNKYVNNPEKTNDVLINIDFKTYYKTGDLAFTNNTGEYFITGRKDDTIKYRGYRIDLLDIDSYIMRLDYIADCVTIAIPNEETENTTIAFIRLKTPISQEEIKKDLATLLLSYQIPEKIFFIDSYPVNNSGKVCKKSLKEIYLRDLK